MTDRRAFVPGFDAGSRHRSGARLLEGEDRRGVVIVVPGRPIRIGDRDTVRQRRGAGEEKKIDRKGGGESHAEAPIRAAVALQQGIVGEV